ncbi:MAG: DUF2807 domain-containing protein [Myxococcota bacterium]
MAPRALGLAYSLLLFAGCAPKLQGDGVATVVERSLESFNALDVAGPIAVEVRVDEKAAPGMHLEGDENLVRLVGWTQVDGTLHLDARGLTPVVPLRLSLVARSLDSVVSSDGAHLTVTKVSGARVTLKAASSARLHALEVDCDALVLDARQGARLEAAGRARLVEASASDGSTVVASSLEAKVAWAFADALSAVHVSASELVRGRALRSSEVRVHGRPARNEVRGSLAST